MKWCPRCHLRPATKGELCGACHVTVTLNKAKADIITDEEIIEHHVFERVKRGCVECGNNDFGYQAGVKEENNLKWYILQVHCDKGEAKYEEIMEVRVIDEPNENDESE